MPQGEQKVSLVSWLSWSCVSPFFQGGKDVQMSSEICSRTYGKTFRVGACFTMENKGLMMNGLHLECFSFTIKDKPKYFPWFCHLLPSTIHLDHL